MLRTAIAFAIFLFGVPRNTLPADPPATPVVLRAASLNPGGNGVALRWTLGQGWLPDGGFNLYRIDAGGRTRLNPEPLGAKTKRGGNAATGRWKVADKSEVFVDSYKVALDKASETPAGVSEESVRAFSPTRHSRPASARPVFDAIGDQVQQLRHTPGPALPANVAQLQIRNDPAVASYMNSLATAPVRQRVAPNKVPSAPVKPGSGPKTPPVSVLSPAEELQTIRRNLLTGAFIHSEIANDLGLSFDDKKAKANEHYQYALRSVDSSGKEGAADVATVTIDRVGSDTPLIPAGLVARQLDEENVGLRWERLTPEQTDAVGMPSYQVYRITGSSGQGVPLSKSPLVLADIPIAGGHLEQINFIQDRQVPVGEVTYQLVQTDMFGRQTKSDLLQFKMEDWQIPSAPRSAQAELKDNDVTIAWEASLLRGQPNSTVQYKIYREDIEQSNDPQPVKRESGSTKAGPLDITGMIRESADRSKDVKRELLTTTSVKGDSFDGAAARQSAAAPEHRGRLAYVLSLHPQGWLKFVDHNVPIDHKYRYLVTASYPKNNMESTGALTTPVLVPVKAAPAPPANVKISVKTTPKSAGTPRVTADSGGRLTIQGRNQRRPIKLPAYFKAIRQLDIGAEVTLNWDAVTGTPPISYRVYRASATGLFKNPSDKGAAPGPKKSSTTTTATSKPGPLSTSHADTANPKMKDTAPTTAAVKKTNPVTSADSIKMNALLNPNVFHMPPAVLQKVMLGKHVFQYFDDVGTVAESSFSLLGEVKGKTTFTDEVPRSQAHRYVYRVVAVNRWGAPAGGPREGIKGSEAKVRVPATMPPSAPAFISVEQDDVGNIDLQFRPNLEEENVTSYEIKRRLMPSPPKQVNSVAGANTKGIARFGIQPSGSAMLALTRSNPSLVSKPLVVAPDENPGGYEVIGTKNPKGAVDGILKFRDPKVTAHQVYSYYIVAINEDNWRSRSGDLLCSAEISPKYDGPAKLNPAATCESVKLSWPVTPDAKGYIVERALKATPGNLIQLSGIGSETTFTDHSVQPGESYNYRVIGVTADGNVTDPVQTEVTVPAK